jgi:hypothetical protein
MNKILPFVLILSLALTACKKNRDSNGCQTDKACTAEFASIGVQFIDQDGNYLQVKNLIAINLRSNAEIVVKNRVEAYFS